MSQDSPKFQLSNWEIVSVNPIDKTWSWKDYFCFWANTTQSLIAFSLIASLYILYDLNIIIVFSGSIFAGLLVYFFSNLNEILFVWSTKLVLLILNLDINYTFGGFSPILYIPCILSLDVSLIKLNHFLQP